MGDEQLRFLCRRAYVLNHFMLSHFPAGLWASHVAVVTLHLSDASVSPKRKIIVFSGLLLQRSVPALNQLLRGYFCFNMMFAKNPISVPNQVLWIFGSMGAPATRCCSHLEISKHKPENMLLKYVACPDIGAWVILSTSRCLFSFEMIKVYFVLCHQKCLQQTVDSALLIIAIEATHP